MLVNLGLHIIITISCLLGGFIFYKILFKTPGKKPAISYALSGLILISTIAQVLTLFMPVKGYLAGMVFVIFIIVVLLNSKQAGEFYNELRNELGALKVLPILVIAGLWLVLLIINSGTVMMDDTESYHIQMVKWVQEYGTVPGLANLHDRFGFNSSWFSSIAIFNFFPAINSYATLNSVISLWFCYYLVNKTSINNPNGVRIASLAVLLFSIVFWPIIRGNAATANYDFITMLVVLVLFIEMFTEKEKNISFSNHIDWIIWPLFLFSVRIINYPFLLLALFAFFRFLQIRRQYTLVIASLLGIAIILPFLYRNFIVSGYLFYPVMFPDLNADWKADPVQVRDLMEYIKYYSRVNTGFMEIDLTKSLGSNWVPAWFNYLFFHDKIILVTGVAGLIPASVMLIFERRKYPATYIVFILLIFLSLLSWFLVAPDPRFIYGVLLSGIFLLFYLISTYLKIFITERISILVYVVLLGGILVYSGMKLFNSPSYRNWIKPMPLPKPVTTTVIIDSIKYHIPHIINDNWNRRCYGTDLPCLYHIDPRLRARGNSIGDGFRLEK